MKLKVLVEFRDKIDHKTMYKVGQVIEVADHKRAANLVARELCDFVEETAEAEKPAQTKIAGKGDKGKGSKKDSKKDPAEGAAGDAPEAGSESGEGVEQNPDQE